MKQARVKKETEVVTGFVKKLKSVRKKKIKAVGRFLDNVKDEVRSAIKKAGKMKAKLGIKKGKAA